MNNIGGKELRVGGLIALGFLIVFGAFFVVGGQQGLFTRKHELKAQFTNVEGLTAGAAVRLGGVKVGNVDKIGFTFNGDEKHVMVVMSINASNFDRIRKDSMAKLGSQGLLGDRTIDITVGSANQPVLKPGDIIPTVEASQLGDLISKGGSALDDLKETARNAKEISWKINRGSGSLAQVLNDPRLYTNLDSLLNMWTDITLKINRGEGVLAKLVNDSELYDNLSGSLSEIKTFLANINAGQGSLGKLAQDDRVYHHMDSVLTSLNTTLVKINGGQGSMGQLVNNEDLYNKMNATVESLNALIIDIKKNPKKYVKISLF